MDDYIYSNNRRLTQHDRRQIVDCLLSHKLSNYGYDWKTFKSMSTKRSQLRKILRFADVEKLNWKNIDLSRFHFRHETLEGYIVCQSANEEITRLMECLVSKKKN